MTDAIVKHVQMTSGREIRVAATQDGAFRIQISDDGVFHESGLSRYGVIQDGERASNAEVVEDDDLLQIKTDKGILEIDRGEGSVRLTDSSGRLVINELRCSRSSEAEGFDLAIGLKSDERFYGLGDETRDRIQKRGHKNKMVVRNVVSYAPSPFLMSSGGWGIFVNTTFFHSVDVAATDPDTLTVESNLGTLDCFLFVGDTLEKLLDQYTRLTGRPTLLPQWAYGLSFVSDERGVRARDVLNDAYRFRQEGIPCDMISLEPSWMETRYDFSVDKKWSAERFHTPFWLEPQAQGTFAGALKNMGFKLGLWLCCDYDLTEYEESLLEDGERGTEYLNEIALDDADEHDVIKDPHFHPTMMDEITKSGEPWFEHLKKFVDDGAKAFKMDGANQVNFHPDRKWFNKMDDREMHNLYPVLLAKQMSLGFMNHAKARSMIYTSGGYAGIQQYAATWAGDTGGGEKPLTSLLNHGLSGHSNTTADMAVNSVEGIHFGFLQPWTQAFSWHQYNQPWFLGEERQETFKFYARLRYRLMPYIYSMARHANQTGVPIARAMPLEFPDDPESDNLILQYMLGSSFLTGAFSKTIYLPKGRWIDYWTGLAHDGGQFVPVEYDHPRGGSLFVKDGSIIPMWPVMNYVGQTSTETILLDVFPGADGAFTLYEDDGESLDHLNGSFAETDMQLKASDLDFKLSISSRQGQYSGMPERRDYHCVFHCEAPNEVKIDDEPVNDFTYDEKQGRLEVVLPNVASRRTTVTVKRG